MKALGSRLALAAILVGSACRCDKTPAPQVVDLSLDAETATREPLIQVELLPRIGVDGQITDLQPLEDGGYLIATKESFALIVTRYDDAGNELAQLISFSSRFFSTQGTLEMTLGEPGTLWVAVNFSGEVEFNDEQRTSTGPSEFNANTDLLLVKLRLSDGFVLATRQLDEGDGMDPPRLSFADGALYLLTRVSAIRRKVGHYLLARIDGQGATTWSEQLRMFGANDFELAADETSVAVVSGASGPLEVQGQSYSPPNLNVDNTFAAIFDHRGKLLELTPLHFSTGSFSFAYAADDRDIVYLLGGAPPVVGTRVGPGFDFVERPLPCASDSCMVEGVALVGDLLLIVIYSSRTREYEVIVTTRDGRLVATRGVEVPESEGGGGMYVGAIDGTFMVTWTRKSIVRLARVSIP